MIRNGGRNGVALSAGFRWAIGKDSSKKSQNKTDQPYPSIHKNTRIVKKDLLIYSYIYIIKNATKKWVVSKIFLIPE